MLEALAADFTALDGASVDLLCDARQPPVELPGVTVHSVSGNQAEIDSLISLAGRVDWTVLIAPEFDGHLLGRARQVVSAGGRLLGPGPQLIALASDKQAAAEYLARHEIPVCEGIALAPGELLPEDFSYPAVLKPRDGAGSLGIERIDRRPYRRACGDAPARLERFYPGQACSVACLCGPQGVVPLQPCWQHLLGEHDFSYLGGSLPIEAPLAARAARLAVAAIRALPAAMGYIGVDLVLGSDPAGSGDVVIEVNPRLTTSYVGLRALSEDNLAAAMVAVAAGADVGVCWKEQEIHFTSSGEIVVGG